MLVRSYKITDTKRFEVFVEDISKETGRVLVKVDYGAVCKADIRYYLGRRDKKVLDLKYPISLIHEACGTVLEDKSGHFKPGCHVVMVPNMVLKKCDNCNCDRYDLNKNYCPKALFASSNFDGFSKEIISIPSENLVRLNSGDMHYVFCELVSVAVSAIRRTSITKNSEVAVFGDGILGYILCSVIKEMYGCIIIVVGKNTDKLKNFSMCDKTVLTNDLKTINGAFTTAFECVGGKAAAQAINDIIDSVSVGGDIVLTGVSEENIPVNTRKILEKGLTVKGSTRSCVSDFEKAISMFESDTFTNYIKKLILGELNIKNIDDYYSAFEKESENSLLGKHILIF